MSIGVVQGQMLSDNLVRNGANLAFDTDLLVLDVINGRVGVNTATPNATIDINGELAATEPVWESWLENDPLTMLTTGGYAGALANTAVYIDCGQNDDLGFNFHAETFSGALTTIGIPHTYIEYTGYSDADAGHSKYVRDRLREIFLFHNAVFQAE